MFPLLRTVSSFSLDNLLSGPLGGQLLQFFIYSRCQSLVRGTDGKDILPFCCWRMRQNVHSVACPPSPWTKGAASLPGIPEPRPSPSSLHLLWPVASVLGVQRHLWVPSHPGCSSPGTPGSLSLPSMSQHLHTLTAVRDWEPLCLSKPHSQELAVGSLGPWKKPRGSKVEGGGGVW